MLRSSTVKEYYGVSWYSQSINLQQTRIFAGMGFELEEGRSYHQENNPPKTIRNSIKALRVVTKV